MVCLRFIVLFLLFSGAVAQASVYAEFTTNREDAFGQNRKFRVLLDTVNAPLAVTHFSLLAGKPDDVWRSAGGASLPVLPTSIGQNVVPMELAYDSTTELRENILVYPVADLDNYPQVKEYVVLTRGQGLELGRLSPFPNGNVYHDISGRGRLEMWQDDVFPFLWRVAIKYPRPWLEPIFGNTTEERFYQTLIVSTVDGLRMHAGTRVIGGKAVPDPGYFTPDELVRVPNVASSNPAVAYRRPFDVPYVLAWDNDGPNTNGSQFFITQVTDPTGEEWNGKYTAFGQVFTVDRLFVSELITLAGSNPGTVTINSIEVKRASPFTTGFFEGYYQNLLPGDYTENVELSMTKVNGRPELLAFSPQLNSDESASLLTRIYAGSDLLNYEYVGSSGIATGQTEPVKQFIDADLFGSQRGFFEATAWEYPFWPSADVTTENAIYEFTVDGPGASSGSVTLVYNLDGTGGTFVDTTQIERTEYRVNPDWTPGSGLDPILVNHWLEPETPSVRNGVFEAVYSPSQGPYSATIQIGATSGELAFDHIELQYSFNPQDHQSALPGAIKGLPAPNGFRAYKDEPDTKDDEGWTEQALEFEGYYYKAQ